MFMWKNGKTELPRTITLVAKVDENKNDHAR